jgi:hypothetical protein
VFSNLLAVQPNRRTKLSLIDAQDGNTAIDGDLKRPAIPEPDAILSGHPRSPNQSGLRQLSLSNAILDNLLAIEEINIREAWCGGVNQARDRGFVVKVRGKCVSGFRISNVPFAIERKDNPLGAITRRRK